MGIRPQLFTNSDTPFAPALFRTGFRQITEEAVAALPYVSLVIDDEEIGEFLPACLHEMMDETTMLRLRNVKIIIDQHAEMRSLQRYACLIRVLAHQASRMESLVIASISHFANGTCREYGWKFTSKGDFGKRMVSRKQPDIMNNPLTDCRCAKWWIRLLNSGLEAPVI